MAKVTEKYETVFLISPALSEEETAALIAKFKNLVESSATLLGEPEEWGKRRLAYEIDDFREAFYVLMRFESEPSFPAELDRVFKITDGILRTLIVKANA